MLEFALWTVGGYVGGVAVGAVGVALRLRDPGESLLSAVGRVIRPRSGPRPTTPK